VPIINTDLATNFKIIYHQTCTHHNRPIRQVQRFERHCRFDYTVHQYFIRLAQCIGYGAAFHACTVRQIFLLGIGAKAEFRATMIRKVDDR